MIGGGLVLVDPADPGTRFEIEAEAVVGPEFVILGQVVPGGYRLDDARAEWMVYAKESTVFAVPLAIEREGGAALEPAALEWLRLPAEVLSLHVSIDLAAEPPVLLCVAETSLGYEFFSVTGDQVSAPLPFPGAPVRALVQPSDFSVLGWFVMDEGLVYRVDRDLTMLSIAVADEVRDLATTPAGDHFLTLDHVLHGYRLDGTLTDLRVLTLGRQYWARSRDELFVAQPFTPISWTGLRTGIDGPPTVFRETAWGTVDWLAVTPERVVALDSIQLSETPPYWALSSAAHDGSDWTVLHSGESLDLFDSEVHARGERLFFNYGRPYTTPQLASSARSEPGPLVVHSDARWLEPRTLSSVDADGEAGIETMLLVRLEGEGALLEAYHPTDPETRLRRLGRFDPRYERFANRKSSSRTQLIEAYEQDGTREQADIYFVDLGETDSLRRLTDTPDVSERVIR